MYKVKSFTETLSELPPVICVSVNLFTFSYKSSTGRKVCPIQELESFCKLQ